ncbi:hypothetical protein [Flavobacterium urocaniciphilum]|uniref:Uncharacterized protein n=1 Tax=Flavobacterium urocaniciphilum TaxID=1299341 RepID=A0A1H9D5E9_9FLAO|nr:hypothetical protein [Flavobacterium urocaniciphilum]SEQ08028.1 hypothetical protein SAMN05444005_10612 [Flavobacterium urocaniciphilum]
MKKIAIIILSFYNLANFAQKNPIGTFQNELIEVTFKNDKSFEYKNKFFLNPAGNKMDSVYFEKGTWKISNDTITLNPQLEKKNFGNDELVESTTSKSNKLSLKFNIIRKYFDANNNNLSIDTLQIESLDFAINKKSKKNISRITQKPTTRCAFAGYIPKELVTNERSFEMEKPTEKISRIYIGCYELGEMKEYEIKNQNSNSFTLNIYQNIYEDGMIRNVKYLMATDNIILIKEKTNGKFKVDGIYIDYYQIKRK